MGTEIYVDVDMYLDMGTGRDMDTDTYMEDFVDRNAPILDYSNVIKINVVIIISCLIQYRKKSLFSAIIFSISD
jgi:hypothetical protein